MLRRSTSLLRRTSSRLQKRNFALGGSHGPPPEWEGIDKVVRGYFPKDYQRKLLLLPLLLLMQ